VAEFVLRRTAAPVSSECSSASRAFRRWRPAPNDKRRGGEKARRFRHEIKPVGVCGPDKRREPREWRGLKPELRKNRVERASLAAVTPENAFDVEGGAVEALRDRLHFRGRDKQQHGGRIDEAANEPRAGDAVDFWSGARHPHRSAVRIALRQFVFENEGQARSRPGCSAARKNLGGRYAAIAQPGCYALAFATAILTNRHRRAPREFGRPGGHRLVRPLDCARNEPRVGGEGVFGAHVDQRRAVRHAD
jgi:hypothetical protein